MSHELSKVQAALGYLEACAGLHANASDDPIMRAQIHAQTDRVRGALAAALVDVENCLILLRAILQRLGGVASWDELWQCSERARVPTRMPFGKHKGELIAEVPGDYKRWLLRQPDVCPYLQRALRGEVA